MAPSDHIVHCRLAEVYYTMGGEHMVFLLGMSGVLWEGRKGVVRQTCMN